MLQSLHKANFWTAYFYFAKILLGHAPLFCEGIADVVTVAFYGLVLAGLRAVGAILPCHVGLFRGERSLGTRKGHHHSEFEPLGDEDALILCHYYSVVTVYSRRPLTVGDTEIVVKCKSKAFAICSLGPKSKVLGRDQSSSSGAALLSLVYCEFC